MTGIEIQQRLEAIIVDLQTVGKGLGIVIVFRGSNNAALEFPLSSDNQGVINDTERENLQAFVDGLKLIADNYAFPNGLVQNSANALKAATLPHEALIEAARVAREAVNAVLAADSVYQAAKTQLDNDRADVDYITFGEQFRQNNVSENYAELANAKGKYT